MKMNITPMQGRLLLKVIKEDEVLRAKGALILAPNPDEKKDLMKAEVLKLGTRMNAEYKETEEMIDVGSTVLFVKWAASEVALDGEVYHLIRYEDIIAVLE